jgi:hypothetical protein
MLVPPFLPDITKTAFDAVRDYKREDELKQLVKLLKREFPNAHKLLLQPAALEEIGFYSTFGVFNEAKMIAAVKPITESDSEAKRLALAIRDKMGQALPEARRTNFLASRMIAEIKHDGEAKHAELINRIEALQAQVAAKLPAARALPAKTKRFADRRDALERARAFLKTPGTDGSAQIVNCVGMIGAGTSAFALELAYDPPRKLPGGALYVDFSGPVARSSDAAAIAAGLLLDLGIDGDRIRADPDERLRQLQSLYEQTPVVILFDNATPGSDLEALIPALPDSIVIVSSQTPLSKLQKAKRIDLAPMGDADAISVLEAIIGERVRDEPQAAEDIAQYCAGLPLALSVTASRIHSQPARTLSEYAKRLASATDLLGALDDREKTLRGALQHAIDTADPDARELLLLLAVLDVRSIEASIVAAILQVDESDAEDRIADLADLALLTRIEGGGWQIHDLLRRLAVNLAPGALDPKRIELAAASRAQALSAEAARHASAIKARS